METLAGFVLAAGGLVALPGAILVLAIAAVLRFGRSRDAQFRPPRIVHLNRDYRRMRTAVQRSTLSLRERFIGVREERRARRGRRGQERRRVFVVDFQGDLHARNVDALEREISTIVSAARDTDEVVVRLQNAGGAPNGHGLGAAQLERVRERGLHLTVAVDRIAASGGYMMACVGDRILAAPFAIVGAIGTFVIVPNLNRLLESHGVDIEQFQSGEHKLTVNMLGRTTESGRDKVQEKLASIHRIFKEFVAGHRPSLDIERVSSGEFWHAREALDLGLVDEIRTSEEYLLERSRESEIYLVRAATSSRSRGRLRELAQAAADRAILYLSHDR